MDFSFELFDLISLVTIMLGLAGTYWKLSERLTVTEHKVDKLESDFVEHEKEFKKDIRYCHEKMNKKLETIEVDMKNLLVEVTKLSSSRD